MEQKAYIAALQWYIDNGVDEALRDIPLDYFAQNKTEIPALRQDKAAVENLDHNKATPPIPGAAQAREEALRLAQKAQNLDELRAAILEFDGIALKKTASNMVFGEGNPEARIMIIGDAPQTEEDKTGRPFMGGSGYLFDLILGAIGLDRLAEPRDNSVYVTNILNWRPPGNRTPAPGEIEASLPFVERHIALVKPNILVFLGAITAQSLLGRNEGLSKLRKSWHEYKPLQIPSESSASIPALVSFHPTYVLGAPLQKQGIWADMLLLKEKIEALK